MIHSSVTPGTMRQSISRSQNSGMILTFVPPRIFVVEMVVGGRNGCLNASTCGISSLCTSSMNSAIRTVALLPFHGMAPWLARPLMVTRKLTIERSAQQTMFSVCSPTITISGLSNPEEQSHFAPRKLLASSSATGLICNVPLRWIPAFLIARTL